MTEWGLGMHTMAGLSMRGAYEDHADLWCRPSAQEGCAEYIITFCKIGRIFDDDCKIPSNASDKGHPVPAGNALSDVT